MPAEKQGTHDMAPEADQGIFAPRDLTNDSPEDLKRYIRRLELDRQMLLKEVQESSAREKTLWEELQNATRPLKQGQRRVLKPTKAKNWLKSTDDLIESAKLRGGHLTLTAAARAVLTVELLRETQLRGDRLQRMVEDRLKDMLKTIGKERRRQRGGKK